MSIVDGFLGAFACAALSIDSENETPWFFEALLGGAGQS